MNLTDFNINYLKEKLEDTTQFSVYYAAGLDLTDQFRPDQKFAVVQCHESFIGLNQGQLQDVYLSIAKGFSAVTMVMVNDLEHIALAIKPI